MSLETRSKLFTHIILIACALFIFLALLWAHFAVLDEVTSGEGKVIPSSQIQVIQNLEGGIVKKILVKEGEVVEKDQVLMQIDSTRFLANFEETQEKIEALEIELTRLEAESSDKEPSFSKEAEKEHPQMVAIELQLYKSRQHELEQLKKALNFSERELQMTKPLVARGAVSEVEVLRLERTVNELRGKISEFRSKTLERLNKVRGELRALQAQNLAKEDSLSRTTIRSPVYGIIKQIKINTIGGVIQPGNDILEIVPLDDTLLIEAKIRPADIGFIHANQKAMVKISAYDFSIYGGLEGKVEKISADTITEEKSGKEESYYLVTVRTNKNHLGTEEKPLPIIPGMMATVDILTGEKSVLDYLLKPILKAKNTALRER